MDLSLFTEVSTKAVLASMAVIRPRQCCTADIGVVGQKPFDRSLVTAVDLESEAAGTAILRQAFPGVPILREEGGWDGLDERARFVIWYDPTDGTRPLVTGAATSTVIATLYDRAQRQIVAVTIGDPATGRVWTSTEIDYCHRSTYEGGRLVVGPVLTQVWEGLLGTSSTVLIENFMAFTRAGGRQILTNAGCIELFRRLQSAVAIQSYGSNGLHHALVANGNQHVVGAITTSMGGPWDCGGAHLVLSAMGTVRAFSVDEERVVSVADPLDPTKYDVLVVANSQSSCDFLSEALMAALSIP